MAAKGIKVKAKKALKLEAETIRFMHIRKFSAQDKQMLSKLKKIFDRKQNAKNLVRAGHEFLLLRDRVEAMAVTISELNGMVDSLSQEKRNIVSDFFQLFSLEEEQVKRINEIEGLKKTLLKKYRSPGSEVRRYGDSARLDL